MKKIYKICYRIDATLFSARQEFIIKIESHLKRKLKYSELARALWGIAIDEKNKQNYFARKIAKKIKNSS